MKMGLRLRLSKKRKKNVSPLPTLAELISTNILFKKDGVLQSNAPILTVDDLPSVILTEYDYGFDFRTAKRIKGRAGLSSVFNKWEIIIDLRGVIGSLGYCYLFTTYNSGTTSAIGFDSSGHPFFRRTTDAVLSETVTNFNKIFKFESDSATFTVSESNDGENWTEIGNTPANAHGTYFTFGGNIYGFGSDPYSTATLPVNNVINSLFFNEITT